MFWTSSKKIGYLIIGSLLVMTTAATGSDVTLETPQGDLVGESVGEGAARVSVFKGVPYAVPPVGIRRWKPTEAAPGWQGKRVAQAFSPACMQPSQMEEHFYYTPGPQMSEDCLYLNVWTGAEPGAGEKRPVMVWIHGGSLVDGSGSTSLYNGAALARKGVVVVTINYRLNVFGYMAHPELAEESPHGASGNYGTLDQIQALKWVQENIAAYGGNPDNVTIFGESAGALSVSHLMATPLSKGLFHRAIMQSSYMPNSLMVDKARFGKKAAFAMGKLIARKAKVADLAAFRELPAVDLLAVSQSLGFYPESVLDGYVFPEDIYEVFAAGKQHDVPLMAGFNSGETKPFAFFGLVPPVPESAEAYVAEVKARYGALADEYLAFYPADERDEATSGAATDGFYGWASEGFVRKMQAVSSDAFYYYFDHVTPAAAKMGVGAHHAAELPYTFNNVADNAKYSPMWPDLPQDATTLGMADVMSDYWVAFAKEGKPAPAGRPVWQAYTGTNHAYMAFRNGKAEPGVNLKPGMFEFHDKLISARRAAEKTGWWIHEIGLGTPKE